MATISHTSQISRAATSSSGNNYYSDGKSGDWDVKLNSLLNDLHGSVTPIGDGKDGRSTEYREYRMTSSTRNNDEPPSTTQEKWIEYGTAHQPQPFLTSLDSRPSAITQSSSSSRNLIDSSRNITNTYSRDDPNFGSRTQSQMEFLDPINTTVSLRSGQTSPLPPLIAGRSSPKVEKKEFYSKASYTTLIKGPQPPDTLIHDSHPQYFPINKSESDFSRETSRYAIQDPVYITPPKVTKPPESPNTGLKTPPLVRKILHQSESFGSHSHKKTSEFDKYPQRPVDDLMSKQTDYSRTQMSPYNRDLDRTPNYDHTDDRNRNVKFYNATTTRTETKETSDNIIRRFPSQGTGIDRIGEPPKRLDDLLATFDESYIETSRIVGDGGGPHGSHPYGPGTRYVEPPQRSVRIDESRNMETEISRRNVNNNVESTRNVTGPPVYYPARDDQLLKSAEQEEMMKGKGKAKAEMERKYKMKEKSKSSHGEKGGAGALPVPVCLPVCCAAPCTIM